MFDFFYKRKKENYIYRVVNDEIFVMKLIPRDFDIIKYKQDILSKYTQEDLFRQLETDDIATMEELYYICYGNKVHNLNYKEDYFYSRLSCICGKNLSDEQKVLLHKYISGDYDDISVKIYTEAKDKYLYLLTTDKNCFDVRGETAYYHHPIYKSDNIICLPKELYLLYLLCKGKYEELVNENVSEQLSLFDFEYITSFKVENYKKLISKGFIDDNESFVIEKVRDSDSILKKIKK